MTSKGYTTSTLVNAALGGVLTAGQLTQAAALVEPVEGYIDRYTGRSWLAPIENELYRAVTAEITLRSAPVASVESVSVWQDGALTPLTETDDYEVRDLPTGLLVIGGFNTFWRGSFNTTNWGVVPTTVWASYTPANLDPLIQQAATLLVIDWLAPTLGAPVGNIKAYSVGQGDLSVTYADTKDRLQAPPAVLQLLNLFRRPVFA